MPICQARGIDVTINLAFFRYGLVVAITSILAASFVLPGITANAQQETTVSAGLDTPFKLSVGQTASIGSENIGLKFLNVTEDSRCHSDVTCVWEGQAKVQIRAEVNGKDAGQMELVSRAGAGDVKAFDQFTIKMSSLDPYPSTTKKITLSDYVATLVVSKQSINSKGVSVKAFGANNNNNGTNTFAIAAWNLDKAKGVMVIFTRDDGNMTRTVMRFTPSVAQCVRPEARECINGSITSVTNAIGIVWRGAVHLEMDKMVLYITADNGGAESSFKIKQIKMSDGAGYIGNTITLGEGQRNGPLLVQKIFLDHIEGLNFLEYPLARSEGLPITLHIGEKASNGCTVSLTLVNILDGGAVFTKTQDYGRPCPI